MGASHDPMAEIRASFFVECEELLESLQDGLQSMEEGDDNPETINVVFRAVHSIKGGGGAFGLTELVRFAHRFETVLDAVRSGRYRAGAEAIKVFFKAADHVSDLVRLSRDGADMPVAASATLVAALDALTGDAPSDDAVEEEIDFQPMGLTLDLDLTDDDETIPLDHAITTNTNAHRYVIEFTPQSEMFETGNEPFMLLRNLRDLGECKISVDASDLPELAQLNPEISHLSWTISLETEVDEAEIASIFEFVDGLCVLKINGINPSDSTPESDMPLPVSFNVDLNPAQDTNIPPRVGVELEPRPSPDAPRPARDPENKPSRVAPETSGGAKGGVTAAKSVVRVDLDRIERLVNLVGELVINQSMLSQTLEQTNLSPHSDVISGLEEFQRLTRDIQDSVMMIRAQPVKSLFQRMSRIVREASAEVGKDVRLYTEGENTEVDKTVIERLADPLTHMIRNAVDHGLETTEDRISAGKAPQGRVNLTAAHRSGRVIIEVSDDGVGINRAKVLQIAIDKGLVPVDAELSDSEIDNLLFLPGFSTASVVSDMSGRGVGMDVVKTAIQSLGGRITTTSQPGQGTMFSISLPLTLAVLDGMVVRVAEETLVLPLNVVAETLTVEEGDVENVRPGVRVVRVRDDFVPLFDLGYELGYRDEIPDPIGAVILLIEYDEDHRAALVIDRIQDQRQVVIKGLDESFYRAPGIAAATILGDGQIALILDPIDIIANALGTLVVAQTVLPTGT